MCLVSGVCVLKKEFQLAPKLMAAVQFFIWLAHFESVLKKIHQESK